MSQATKTATQNLASIAAEINHAIAEIRHAAWVLNSAANSETLGLEQLRTVVISMSEQITKYAEKIST